MEKLSRYMRVLSELMESGLVERFVNRSSEDGSPLILHGLSLFNLPVF
jgi:hypothetical protein